MSEIPIRETHLPEPRYQCAGAADNIFRTAAISEVHPRFAGDDGFHPAGELYWVTLVDRECEESCTDFFCSECIQAMGKKTSGKTNLQKALTDRIRGEAVEAGTSIAKFMKIGEAGR